MRQILGWLVFSSLLGVSCGENSKDTTGSIQERLVPTTLPAVGVSQCDTYLARYEQCIQTSFPQALRSQALSGLRANRDSWFALADTAFKKEALGRVCNNARTAATTELAAYGCNWGS
jgi:hypothetical protein